MKAITLHQPYAAAMAGGFKRYETRSWKTNHRGPIAIHAAKKPVDNDQFEALYQQANDLVSRRFLTLPGLTYGTVVAVGVVQDCIEMTPEMIDGLDPVERLLGDWEPGRFAWLISNIKKFETPIEARGQQGLWDVDDELLIQPAIPVTDEAGNWLSPKQRLRYR